MDNYLLSRADLNVIVSNAKNNICGLSLPLYVSHKEVDQKELVTVAVLESVLMLLNHKKLLTKTVSLDYTNASANFEIDEE